MQVTATAGAFSDHLEGVTLIRAGIGAFAPEQGSVQPVRHRFGYGAHEQNMVCGIDGTDKFAVHGQKRIGKSGAS